MCVCVGGDEGEHNSVSLCKHHISFLSYVTTMPTKIPFKYVDLNYINKGIALQGMLTYGQKVVTVTFTLHSLLIYS